MIRSYIKILYLKMLFNSILVNMVDHIHQQEVHHHILPQEDHHRIPQQEDQILDIPYMVVMEVVLLVLVGFQLVVVLQAQLVSRVLLVLVVLVDLPFSQVTKDFWYQLFHRHLHHQDFLISLVP